MFLDTRDALRNLNHAVLAAMDVPMSWEDFLRCSKEIVEVSDRICDGWNLQQREHGLYLTKKVHQTIEQVDLVFEYHVVYNASYGTPMMCLNVWGLDGALVGMERCWELLGFKRTEDMYVTLTQMDHPVLMRPFLTLHPCKTEAIMNSMFSRSRNGLVSWLSAVAAAVNLRVDCSYAELT